MRDDSFQVGLGDLLPAGHHPVANDRDRDEEGVLVGLQPVVFHPLGRPFGHDLPAGVAEVEAERTGELVESRQRGADVRRELFSE